MMVERITTLTLSATPVSNKANHDSQKLSLRPNNTVANPKHTIEAYNLCPTRRCKGQRDRAKDMAKAPTAGAARSSEVERPGEREPVGGLAPAARPAMGDGGRRAEDGGGERFEPALDARVDAIG